MSCKDLITKIDQSIHSFWQIRTKLLNKGRLNRQGRSEYDVMMGLDEIWKKYETMLIDGLFKELQEKMRQLVTDQEVNTDSFTQEQDLQSMLGHFDSQPEDQQRWKTFLKLFRSGQSQYTAHGQNLNYLRQRYLNFSNSNEYQCDQFLHESLNTENQQNKIQTDQIYVQTEYFGMGLNQSLIQQKKYHTETQHYFQNLQIPKPYIPSINYSPSPVNSQKESQVLSPGSQVKDENHHFLSTTNQSSPNQNYHRFVLNSITILLYVLKNMDYLLPIGYLSEIYKNLMDCRTLVNNNDHLQDKQFEIIEKVYKKVGKKMKNFKKQMRKEYSDSKMIDTTQKIKLKIKQSACKY